VEDTGVGIQKGEIKQLFKMFGKLKNTDHINKHGVGLGLTICKKLCEQLGGGIRVESEYGKGTSFFFTLLSKVDKKERKNLNNSYFNTGMIEKSPRNINHTLENPRGCLTPRGIFRKDIEDILSIGEEPSRNICRDIPITRKNQASPKSYDISKNFGMETIKEERKEEANLSDIFIEGGEEEEKVNLLNPEIKKKKQASLDLVHKSSCNYVPVLLVDDNVFNLSVTESLIKNRLSLKSEKAMNGQLAIDKVVLRSKDQCHCGGLKLILMDCNMPVMDGYEATTRLKEMMREGIINPIPIVALTAFSTVEDKKRCYLSGMSDFLVKPVMYDDLEVIFRKYKLYG